MPQDQIVDEMRAWLGSDVTTQPTPIVDEMKAWLASAEAPPPKRSFGKLTLSPDLMVTRQFGQETGEQPTQNVTPFDLAVDRLPPEQRRIVQEAQGAMDRPSGRDYYTNAMAATGSGLATIAADVPKGIAIAIKAIDTALPESVQQLKGIAANETPLHELGQAIEGLAADILPIPDDRLRDSFLATKLPAGAGNLAGFLAGGAAGKALKAGNKIMFLMGAGSGASSQYDNAKALDPNNEEGALLAAGFGGLTGLADVVVPSRALSNLSRASQPLKKAISESIQAAAVGGATEASQTFADNLVARIYDPERPLTQDVMEAGGLGSILGSMAHAGSELVKRASGEIPPSSARGAAVGGEGSVAPVAARGFVSTIRDAFRSSGLFGDRVFTSEAEARDHRKAAVMSPEGIAKIVETAPELAGKIAESPNPSRTDVADIVTATGVKLDLEDRARLQAKIREHTSKNGLSLSAQLDEGRKEFIRAKVDQIGDPAKVAEVYDSDSIVDRYAREYSLSRNTDVQTEPTARPVEPVNKPPQLEQRDEVSTEGQVQAEGQGQVQNQVLIAAQADQAARAGMPAPPQIAKQPWEMTKAEFEGSHYKKSIPEGFLSESKVTAPLYHGSSEQFDSFSRESLGASTGAKTAGLGVFFSENPGVAKFASGGFDEHTGFVRILGGKELSLYRARVRLKNPLDLNNITRGRLEELEKEFPGLYDVVNSGKDKFEALRLISRTKPDPVPENYQNYARKRGYSGSQAKTTWRTDDPVFLEWNKEMTSRRTGQEVARDKLQSLGYDGISVKTNVDSPEAPRRQYVVFDPINIHIEQRSAIGSHHDAVKWAVDSGKSVPPEVLAEYPDLAKSAPAKKPLKKPVAPRTALALSDELANYEKQMGYDAVSGKVEGDFKKLTKKHRIVQMRDSDAKWQELSTARDRARTNEQSAFTRGEKGPIVEEANRTAESGDVTREAIVYAPLHKLVPEVRKAIQEYAAILVSQTKSEKVRAALEKIIRDAGEDTGAAVEKQKARIVDRLTGEGQSPEMVKGWEAPHTDPLFDAIISAKDPATRQKAIEAFVDSRTGDASFDPAEIEAGEKQLSDSGTGGLYGQATISEIPLTGKQGKLVMGGEDVTLKAKDLEPVEPTEPAKKDVQGQMTLASSSPVPIPMVMDPKNTGGVSNMEIIATLSKEFGIPIRTGRVRNPKAGGIYKVKPEVVRLKSQFGGDIGITTHEIAHHIDKLNKVTRGVRDRGLREELRNLDYDPKRRRAHEGFAEFVRHYLTQDDSAQVAPAFHDWFTNQWLPSHPEIAAQFKSSRGLIDTYRQQGAEARVMAQISKTGKPAKPLGVSTASWIGDTIKSFTDRAYAAMKDEGHYLNLFEKEGIKRGSSLKKGDRPYQLYKAFNQTGPALAERAAKDGVFLIGKNDFNTKIAPGIAEVLSEVPKGEQARWKAWMYARHALDPGNRGKPTGISEADAKHVYDSGKGNAHWVSAADKLKALNDGLIFMLADSGAISKESAVKILDHYENYLPLMRVADPLKKQGRGETFVNLGDAVQRRKGSALQIIDPVAATVQRMVRFYTRAAQQQVINSVFEMADKTEGLGGWVEKIPPNMKRVSLTVEDVSKQLEGLGVDPALIEQIGPEESLFFFRPDYTPPGGKPIARVNIDGKPQMAQFDPDLYRAISGMNYFQLPYALDLIFGKATRMLKLGATGLSINFGVKNPMRDYGVWLMQSKTSPKPRNLVGPPEMLATYIYSKAKEMTGATGDPIVKAWEEMGGKLTTSLGLDIRNINKRVDEIMANTTKARALQVFKHPVDFAREVVGVTEVGPRLAEFKATLKEAGYTGKDLLDGKVPRDVLVDAKNDAADVTINFSRMGYVGKWLNQTVPFWNAVVEGSDKAVRTIKDRPGRTAAMLTAAAAATLAYWNEKKDEAHYSNQESWLKWGFWTVTDDKGKPVARFPKPPEWSAFINGVEALADTMYRKDPEAMTEWLKHTAEVLTPPITPAIAQPGVETYFNYDTFRDRPIDTERDEKRLPEDRFDNRTTELMKGVGKWLGVSPKRVEHLFQGHTGGLYRGVTAPVEKAVLGKGSAATMPGVSAFTMESDHQRAVGDVYDQARLAGQTYTSAKDRGEVPLDVELKHRKLTAFAQDITDIRKLSKADSDRDTRFETEKYAIGLARAAMGLEEVDRYPNPYKSDNLPREIDEIVKDRIRSKADTLSTKRPDAVSKIDEWIKDSTKAAQWFKDTGTDYATARNIFDRAMIRKGTDEGDKDKALAQFQDNWKRFHK